MSAGAAAVESRFGPAQAAADSVLYEGYLLYPYRRSSAKNRYRWQFGVLTPPAWARAHGLDDVSVAGSAESWWQQTECLLQAPAEATVHLRVRFLHLLRRQAEEPAPGGGFRAAGRIEAAGRTELSFDEAVPREQDLSAAVSDLLAGKVRLDVQAPGGERAEAVPGPGGALAGRVRRRLEPVRAALTASAEVCPAASPLLRLRVRVENVGAELAPSAPREDALAVSLLATHLMAAVEPGSFLSLLDPPPWAEQAARACVNVHTFPVLAGQPGNVGTVLSSPILLPDHPQVAAESPGDLYDATEIDEILSLRTLTLTEAEKQEARATDPRAAQILDRVDSMPPEVMRRLHGAIRSLRPATPKPDAAVWVAGVRIAKGSRVRLHPRTRGTDAQDMFLSGRTARVEAVLTDLDGACQLAVILDDDPGADLEAWYGRFRYFSPEEVEPAPGDRPAG